MLPEVTPLASVPTAVTVQFFEGGSCTKASVFTVTDAVVAPSGTVAMWVKGVTQSLKVKSKVYGPVLPENVAVTVMASPATTVLGLTLSDPDGGGTSGPPMFSVSQPVHHSAAAAAMLSITRASMRSI